MKKFYIFCKNVPNAVPIHDLVYLLQLYTEYKI